MMFWIAILAGALFIWLAVRMGFYETWVLFFNIVVSIYVSVFLTPILAEFAPAPTGASSYHTALCMIVLAGGCFALLQGLSFVFLTGQYHIPFPRVFDVVFSGVLGFVTGFLTLSFVALVLTTTPLAESQDRRRPRVEPAIPTGKSCMPHSLLRRDPLLCRFRRRRRHAPGRPPETPADEHDPS